MPHTDWLWFDVEKRYNTTVMQDTIEQKVLWFDVEKRYNTIFPLSRTIRSVLWFDVEKRYNTTDENNEVRGG